ncbi:hypothetical protein [Corallococcus llansteffanensis]|uniref:Uncharacterized protein n=1 Tax=Corallococcus llansteffanensis TaxID=2316731 RepID=A0A3A8PQ51_9BACT|nr:hypothetical protein [Corallococcus llansteffanensis]RKH56891.1 hypothetical protein D7V93_19355 [Corallococcus llansteffanensis]
MDAPLAQSLAQNTLAGVNVLARQPVYDGIYNTGGRFPAQAYCYRTRFTPGASVPISSYSNDPKTPTSESNLFYLGSGCPFYDANGNGIVDYNFIFHPRSLRDIGEHEYSCWLDTVPHSGWCWNVTTRPPCNYLCEATVAARQYITLTYNVVNYPPYASPTFTPAAPNWTSRVQFTANSGDPDGGSAVVHRWSVTSRPTGSVAALVNAGTATPSLQLGNEKDIGTWVFRLEVDDDEGETRSYSVQFTVPNVPPIFEIAGASQVVVRNNIQLGVTSTTDIDGGNLTFTWDILQAPAGATPGAANGYSTQSSISIPTTGKEVGTWRFRVTARDNEGASVSREITVTVVNKKPRIQLSGATHVDEGNAIRQETTILDDEDGGLLTFKWEVVQAPQSASVAVPSVLSTSAVLSRSIAQSVPGSWIFRLTATDDENESVTQEVTVLLDGLPEVAFENEPENHVIGSGPLVLDATPSEDPDSPCPTVTGRCHLTDGRFVTVSAGISSYAWYASPGSGEPLVRVSTLFPQVGDSGPVLTFGPDVLSPGDWTFEVRVQDAESNDASSSLVVHVEYADTAPEVHVVGPVVRPTVLLSGLNLVDIIVDGSQSIDPDNTFDGTPASPGLGITQFQWTAVGPAGCPVITLPGGPDVMRVTLFPANTIVPPACHGRWRVTLTVTDDNEDAQQSVGTAEFFIGNCVALACLDAPVPGNERIVLEDDTSGVLVATHLDSAFYDELVFAMGTSIIMDVVYSGTSVVAFQSVTPVLNQSSRGLPIFLFWDGKNSQGARLAGTFDIVLSVHAGVSIIMAEAVGPRVVVLENVTTVVDASSDVNVHREALVAGTDTASFVVLSSGIRPSHPVDSIRWRVKNDAGVQLASGSVPAGTGSSTTVNWDGRFNGSVLNAGNYTFEAEAVRNGVGLGMSAPHLFTLYSAVLDPVVVEPASVGALPEWVHLERSLPAVDVTTANFTQRRLRMSPLLLKVAPVLTGGTLTLEQESGPVGLVELYLEGATYSPVTLPRQWDKAATPAAGIRLLAYGKGAAGDATFKMTYRVNGQVFAEERVRYRLGPPPAAVGIENLTHAPHFRELRTVNAGSSIRVALDRTRQRERTGRRANVFLVNHKDAAAWAANSQLVAVGTSAPLLDVGAANAAPAVVRLWTAATAGSYDVVYDFGNFADAADDFVGDGRLDPGDLLVSPEGLPAVDVEGSSVTPGALAIRSFEYGGAYDAPLYTAHLPANWDGIMLGGAVLPLRGLAIYPVDLSIQRPIVVIAHGRHTPRTIFVEPAPGVPRVTVTVDTDMTSDENYRGYRYLQEHLASRGFITVSIDLDSLFGSLYSGYPAVRSAGIQARAWLMLKTLELLLTNPAAVPDLAGKIDASRIYLAGHSRGGEAVVVAQSQLQNWASSTPTPGSLPPGETLGGGLSPSNIKGLISLAPVSFAAENLPLAPPTAPYLLIYGTADGDVNGASNNVRPFMHYDQARGDRFALRIEGANHNHFNTSWGYSDAKEQLLVTSVSPLGVPDFTRKDLGDPVGAVATLLDGPTQRQVGMAYITAFLRMVDGGSRAASNYFLQQPSTLAPLGTPAGVQMYSQAQLATRVRTVLDDYESNASLTLSSLGAPVAFTVGAPSEGPLSDSDPILETDPANRFFQATRGVLFDWSGASSYEETLPVGKRDLRTARSLNFRAAQVPFHPLTMAGTPLSFRVELEDGAGHLEAVSLNGFHQVAPIYPAGIWTEPYYLDDGSLNPARVRTNTTSAAFKTFRLPLAGFAGTATDVDLGNITKVRIRLADGGETAQGRVALDDLEIEF